MASVIASLVNGPIGANTVSAEPTWVPGSHCRSGVLMAYALKRILSIDSETVVHVHLSHGGSFVREGALVRAARRRGCPTVVSIHGPAFGEFAHRHPRATGFVLSAAHVVTVLSAPDEATVRSIAPRVPVYRVENPVDVDHHAPSVHTTDELVLFAGEIGRRKGVDVLCRAWETVSSSRPNARCVLIGPVADFDLPRHERLEVRKAAPRSHVTRLIREARVVALPSRGEVMPMILLEAMASGRPFVSTPTGAVPELKIGGDLVPIGDPERLASALCNFLSHPTHAAEVGSAGRRLCETRFSAEAVDAQLRLVYERAHHDRWQ